MIGEGLGAISEIFIPLRQWILVVRRKNTRLSKRNKKTADLTHTTSQHTFPLHRTLIVWQNELGLEVNILWEKLLPIWGKLVREKMFLFLENSISVTMDNKCVFLVFVLTTFQATCYSLVCFIGLLWCVTRSFSNLSFITSFYSYKPCPL